MIKNNKQRLFEMMNRVGGMPLVKEIESSGGIAGLTMPAGFSTDDFLTDDEMSQIECGVSVNEIREKKPKKVKAPAVYGSMGGQEAKPLEDAQALAINKEDLINKLNIKTTNLLAGLPQGGSKDADSIGRIDTTLGKKLKFGTDEESEKSLNDLAKILMVVPTDEQILGKNEKMGKSNFYNITLPALISLIYNQKDHNFYVVTTCPNAKECKKWCYAQMGNYIKSNPAVRLNMQKLNYLFNHYDEWKSRVTTAINAKAASGENFSIRWHDAGDFISEKYLDIAIEVADATPTVKHYAYTKMVDMVKSKSLPANFQIRLSFGGEQDMASGSTKGIDRTSDYHADTVPKDMFKKYQPKRRNRFLDKAQTIPNPEYSKNQIWKISPENMRELKNEIRAKYGFDDKAFDDKVLTHNEYMEILDDPNYNPNENIKRWIVVNKMGDTDIPANQVDVLGVYNLQHN